ncbi:MAG: hypothetical protein ACK5Q5_22205 [Planctomycetaceae bacterium]
MPIKFRCPHCQQFLGISRSRAGAVTDCPMCGRSIRVPLLDGSVEPLPSLELNLEDQGLASALDKLASLVGTDDAQPAEAESRPAPAVRSVIAAAPAPVPLPEPIVLSPAPAASMTPATNAPATPSPRPSEQVLASLARLDDPESRSTPNRRTHSPSARRWRIGAGALAIAAALFALGYWVGRHSQPIVNDALVSPRIAAEESPPDEPIAASAEPAVTGRILYVDAQRESRPDAGARVLVLPEERGGTSKLPAEGFRSGAAEADRQIALAAIHAAGGDFAIADEEGQFALRLPQAGLYQLIVLSRYQPRAEGVAVDPAIVDFLAQYFDRPLPLIGDGAAHVRQFRYRGAGTSARDHVFESR